MKSLLSLVLLFTISLNTYGHSDSDISYQYGQVLVSIKTGRYNRVQEDVKLLGRLVNSACRELGISDTVHLDFIHEYGCLYCPSYYMFSKSEPIGYYVEYNGGDNFKLRQANHSDSLNVSSIESTIRIVGSRVNLHDALKESVLFLYYQNKLDSTDFVDRFTGHAVYKSVFSNSYGRFFSSKENKKLLKLIDKLLSELHWLDYSDPDVKFAYYFKDSLYYVITKKDSSLIDTFKTIYTITEATGHRGNIYLFVFSSPLDFKVVEYSDDYPFDDESLQIHSKVSKRICGLREFDIGLNGNWHIKWLYGDVFLFDHSFFLGTSGPFVQYDARKREIILTQKR